MRWDWEIYVPELETSVFLMPASFGGRNASSGVKNGEDRLVVLNSVAKSVIDKQRGQSKEWVFPYDGTAMHRMNDSAWKKARGRAGNEPVFHTRKVRDTYKNKNFRHSIGLRITDRRL